MRKPARQSTAKFGKGDDGRQQHALHGLAWYATYAATLRELASYAQRLDAHGRLGEVEQLLCAIAAGEYLNQMAGGIPMNQGEFARPAELGLSRADVAPLYALALIDDGNTAEARARLVELLTAGATPDSGLDETLVRNALADAPLR